MTTSIVGGVEGGATHSSIVLLDSEGNILAAVKGPGTNHHLTGMQECQKRLADLVNLAKAQANIPTDTHLRALGLSLSGCEQLESNQELVRGLKETYPNLSDEYAVGSDTEGSIAATSNCGGITCIAGTGSNTLLINPDGTRAQCGGWGFLLGDEGSAWKISFRAIKYCFDDLDNFEEPPYPTTQIWNNVKTHFNIEVQNDFLDAFYQNFCKAKIASFCIKIAELAKNGDKLSQAVFEEAGSHLARSVSAVLQRADSQLLNREEGVQVVCVGSVWLSWDLLKPGFVTWLRKNTDIEKLELVRITCTMGIGAAYMAADNLGIELNRDYSNNYKTFFRYDRKSAFIN